MLLFDCSVLELRFEKKTVLRLMQNVLTINGKGYNSIFIHFFIFQRLYYCRDIDNFFYYYNCTKIEQIQTQVKMEYPKPNFV